MAWYQGPAIAGLIGALGGALITGAIALFIWFKGRTIKRIDCAIGNPTSLLSETIKKKLSVTYESRPVSSAFLFSLEVTNSGTVAVKNQPIIIQLAEGSTIVEHKIETEPKIGFGAVTASQKEHLLELNAELLNKRDRIRIEIISIDNPSDNIEVGLKNEDVESRVFTQESVENVFAGLSKELPLIALSSLSILPIVGSITEAYTMIEIARRIERIGKRRN